jgi:hypothetical protein
LENLFKKGPLSARLGHRDLIAVIGINWLNRTVDPMHSIGKRNFGDVYRFLISKRVRDELISR